MNVPFGERGGRLRGGLDLVAGRYPRFVFGGAVDRLLPVFHFHDEPREGLEAKLQYLADNQYRTVAAADIAAFIGGSRLPDRAIALCFDDAWASVWTRAGVLLKKFGLQAILYAIPGRTDDAESCRPQEAVAIGSPFATWPELRALAAEGSFDVQSHTFSHAMISTTSTPTDFVQPGYELTPFLGRPLVDEPPPAPPSLPAEHTHPIFTTPDDLGAPLYPTRSRMSDAPRVWHTPSIREACLRLVRREGGAAFFTTRDWKARLEAAASGAPGTTTRETEAEQQARIEDELDVARTVLNHGLNVRSVNHVCLPWGISSPITEAALARLGFVTAVANRMSGMFAVRPGDHPFWLKRLPNRYIYRLPGNGRRWWFFGAQ